VINQMLRDLDARGQGDAASRHAAMASVGQAVGHRRPAWRSQRVWWLAAAASVALALTAVLLVVNRWQAIDRLAEAPAVTPTVPAPASVVPSAPLPVIAPATEITAAESSVSQPGASPDVASPAPQPAAETPAAERRAPVDPPPRPDPMPPPVPPPQPAPAARATIERVAAEVDPLDAARNALAEGRAEAALAALAAQPEAGAEGDALEAAALQQLGRHAEAERAYRRALGREPDVGAWWAGLGISLDASGRGDEALDAFREAQRRGPLDPALADYLGERVEALSAGEPSR
jgi:tetratricopeptide (TPR) repeat protein